MLKPEKLTATIDHDWAEWVYEWGARDIYEYNPVTGDDILEHIDLSELADLNVRLLSDEAKTYDQRRMLHTGRSVIELAFQDPAFMTLTPFLREAVTKQKGYGNILTKQLRERMRLSSDYHGEEIWFIPADVVALVNGSRLD